MNMKNDLWPSHKVAIRIQRPKLFIFMVWRLLQKNLKRDLLLQDLLSFLEIEEGELKIFCNDKIPFYLWLDKLTGTKEGCAILHYFEIDNEAGMFCMDPDWENERKTSLEEMDNDIFHEVAVESEICVQKSLKHLTSLASRSESEEEFLENTNNTTDEDKAMSTAKTIIPEKKRQAFLAGLQSALGVREGFLFEQEVRVDSLTAFRKDGAIPEEWIALLEKRDGGLVFLERHSKVAPEDNPVKPVSNKTHPLLQNIKGARKAKGLAIPKKHNAAVIDNVKKLSDVKTDTATASVLDVTPCVLSVMRHGNAFMYASHFDVLSEKLNLTVDAILDIDSTPDNPVGKNEIEQDAPIVESEAKLDKPGVVSESDSSVSAARNIPEKSSELPEDEISRNLPLEVEQVIQSALLLSGSIPDPETRKTFFLGYLVAKVKDYCLQYCEDDDKIIFKNDQAESFEYSLSHLSFDF